MKGFVPTPPATARLMVEKLFAGRPPWRGASLLDPGCGDGEFIDAVIAYLRSRSLPVPRIVGVELDPGRAAAARSRFERVPEVEIRESDFLADGQELFDFVIGNPPYVPITGLSLEERDRYRLRYRSARGRFDLYVLFFEQALRLLSPRGRLVFITPEKFLYVESAGALRALMRRHSIAELHFQCESTFSDLVTYPLVTTLDGALGESSTIVRDRSGECRTVTLRGSEGWWAVIQGSGADDHSNTLADATRRISCGVATGADSVFVVRDAELPRELLQFSHPTLAGRQIHPDGTVHRTSSLLSPYDGTGRLLPETALGALGTYLRSPARRLRLEARTCVERKPWYAFHDNLPLDDLLRPKLLCKDITERPFFVTDATGRLVPRHSIYYVVPAEAWQLAPLAEYLNSGEAVRWLSANCQRAANGFLRLQSHVLKRLPVPEALLPIRSANGLRRTALTARHA